MLCRLTQAPIEKFVALYQHFIIDISRVADNKGDMGDRPVSPTPVPDPARLRVAYERSFHMG